DLLRERPQRALLCCSRQAGKSTTAAAACVHEALYQPGSLALLFAPGQRQTVELLRTTRSLLAALQIPEELRADSQQTLEFTSGSRIVALPAQPDTIRGYSAVTLIVLDEAAFVPDDLYEAVRPMLAVSKGRLLGLSTPNGQRGWFHREWTSTADWHRTQITAPECPPTGRDIHAQVRR